MAILAIVGVIDLTVGVGNDAVNFLNSAIGSKVAKFKVLMTVATVGIIFGALSSAGMMEIARVGIFNPEYFTLENVIIIFLAVMLTDIILLDGFNTLGLPTSTTVSVIFELLGASVIVAAYKVLEDKLQMTYLFDINDVSNGVVGYLNWSKTKTIISGIFLSVFIAFTTGAIVMWITRLLFSFQYIKRLKHVGVIWSSLAMLAMMYFLVYKGLKSTFNFVKVQQSELIAYHKSINPVGDQTIEFGPEVIIKNVSGENLIFKLVSGSFEKGNAVYEVFFGSEMFMNTINYIQDNFITFLGISFLFWVLFFTTMVRMKKNPLRFVVFSGVFSLSMAFAGNDLVNFVGVPLAGWQSYDIYQTANIASGNILDSSTFLMSGLRFPIKTPYVYLLLIAIIMILTLWFSKKIRTVSETEVKLASQDETQERFASNFISRGIVRWSIKINDYYKRLVPLNIQNKINHQFIPITHPEDADVPAFDLVRASVNMTIASMLIAVGTSLKLPLSTTYVTFMVAMGSSLSDRAWGRESASYRIAGVFNVILGWFATALAAFTTAAIVALILMNFKLAGLIFVCILIVAFFLNSNYRHKQSIRKKLKAEESLQAIDLTTDKALNKTATKLASSLSLISTAYDYAIEGLIGEDIEKIVQSKTINTELSQYYSDIKNNMFRAIKKSKLDGKKTAQLYILSNDMMQDILQSLTLITNTCDTHIKNAHKPLTQLQTDSLRRIKIEVITYINSIAISLETHDYNEIYEFRSIKRSIFDNLELALSKQVEGINQKAYGFKNSDLMLSVLLETKDLIAISVRFSKLLHRLVKGQSPLGNRDVN